MEKLKPNVLMLKLIVFAISNFYLLFTHFTIGIGPEHLGLVLLYNICLWIGGVTQKIMTALSVFVVFAILYDLMKIYPNYLANDVDIARIYQMEKKLFGIPFENKLYTPNEFLKKNQSISADLISGFFYINWMPVPIAFAIYFYFKNKARFLHYSFTFLLVNLIGFTIYYIYPAAPPWYVEKYGLTLNIYTPGNTANLVRFDEFLGIPLFQNIYTKNSNIFAALPSLHASYPVVVFYFVRYSRNLILSVLCIIFMIGIWFSAVYSCHHYVIDIFAGILCAIAGILIYQKLIRKRKSFQKFLLQYLSYI